MEDPRGAPGVALVLEGNEARPQRLGRGPVADRAGLEQPVTQAGGETPRPGGEAGKTEVFQVRDGGALADAADHEPAIDAPQQSFEVGILRGVGPDHRVLDADADARVDQPRHDVEARVLVGAEIALVLQIKDEPEAGGIRDLAQPRLEAGGVPRVAARKSHRAREAVPAEQRRLVQGPPEGRADARDRPVVVGESGKPPQQLLVLGEGHVVEERVAAVEESGQSSGGHVADEAVALSEIDAAPGLGSTGERGDGEYAAQIVGGERCSLHREVLARDSTPRARGPREALRP